MNVKKIHKVSLVSVVILIVYLSVIITVFYLLPNKNVEKKEMKFKNTFSKKHSIETNLDLTYIFIENNVNGGIDNSYETTPVVFHNNKIYFAFVPYGCSYNSMYSKEDLDLIMDNCNAQVKEICSNNTSDIFKNNNGQLDDVCEPDYCKNEYSDLYVYSDYNVNSNTVSLCKFLNISEDDINNEYEDDKLNVRYVLESNIDGSELKMVKKYDLSGLALSFDYLTNNSLFYVETDSGTYKMDLKSSEIKKISKDSILIGSSPFSNDKRVAIGSMNNKGLSLDFYDINSLDKVDSETIVMSNNTVRLDKFSNDYYTYHRDNNKIYKNNIAVYDTSSLSDYYINDYFSTKDYFYIIYSKEDFNGKVANYLAKIDKKDYVLKDQFQIASNDNVNIKYLMTNDNDEVFLSSHYSLYKFNEKEKKVEEINKSSENKTISGVNSYHNYIYYSSDGYNLVFYNTITNQEINLSKKIVYFYLNKVEDRVYIVEINSGKLELVYYDINS